MLPELDRQFKAPDLLADKLRSISSDSKILEFGANGGQLFKSINIRRNDLNIIGIDDRSINNPEKNLDPNKPMIKADIMHLPFQNVDIVLAINVLHQICESPEYDEKIEKFSQAAENISRVIKNKGEFILFDGIIPADGYHDIFIQPKSDEAKKGLEKFVESYVTQKINFSQIDGGYSTDMLSIVLLQTNWGYLNQPVPEAEKTQFDPFLKEKDMLTTLLQYFKHIDIEYPQKRIGVEKFLNEFNVFNKSNGSVSQLEIDTFPQTQIFINAVK
jgi:hypothetical protein